MLQTLGIVSKNSKIAAQAVPQKRGPLKQQETPGEEVLIQSVSEEEQSNGSAIEILEAIPKLGKRSAAARRSGRAGQDNGDATPPKKRSPPPSKKMKKREEKKQEEDAPQQRGPRRDKSPPQTASAALPNAEVDEQMTGDEPSELEPGSLSALEQHFTSDRLFTAIPAAFSAFYA